MLASPTVPLVPPLVLPLVPPLVPPLVAVPLVPPLVPPLVAVPLVPLDEPLLAFDSRTSCVAAPLHAASTPPTNTKAKRYRA